MKVHAVVVGKAVSRSVESTEARKAAPVFIPAPAGLAAGAVRRLATGTDPLGGSAVPEETLQILRRRAGSGGALPTQLAAGMERSYGADFSRVRVHTDGEAQQVTHSLGARAFTQGSDIYFGAGSYQPGSPAGQHILAHELAHVVQGGTGGSSGGATIGRADDPAEAQADRMADAAIRRLATSTRTTEHTTDAQGADGSGPAIHRLATSTGAASPIRRLPKVLQNLVDRVTGKKTKTQKTKTTKTKAPKTKAPEKSSKGKKNGKSTSGSSKALKLAADRTGTTPNLVATVLATTTTEDPTPNTTTEPLNTAEGVDTDTPKVLAEEPEVTTQEVPVTTEPTGTSRPPTDDLVPSVVGSDTIGTVPVDEATVVQEPVVKPAKETFREALDPATAPSNLDEGNTRMAQLRILLGTMTQADRKSIADDRVLLGLALTHLGGVGYMTLLAALDINVRKRNKKKGTETKHHLTGAEADKFLADNIGRYPHLVPYFEAAVRAGKKGEGFIATVGKEDWDLLYGVQFTEDTPTDAVGGSLEKSTNAYVGDRSPDQPAVLHADRGTPSTAIHESMHRYSDMGGVLVRWGFNLNEGMTEYFTRLLTNQNAQPSTSGPERTNYPTQIEFVRGLIRVLGATLVEQQTTLADIYFKGELDKLKAKFEAAWKAKESTIGTDALRRKWTAFEAKLKASRYTEALSLLPAA